MTQDYRDVIRRGVRGMYDMQDCRIRTGQRIVSHCKVKLGIVPGTKEDTDKKAKEILDTILAEYEDKYDTLSDALTDDGGLSRKLVREWKVSPGLISDAAEYAGIRTYLSLRNEEKRLTQDIRLLVEEMAPEWEGFFRNVHGCGTGMAGVMIGEFRAERARHVGSYWAYAGLDVVMFAECPKCKEQVRVGDITAEDMGKPCALTCECGESFETAQLVGQGRGRRASHLIDVAYKDKNGKDAVRKGITFNPFVKTKMLGVLGPSLIKAQGHYAQVYYDHKARMEAHSIYGIHNDGKEIPNRGWVSKGRRHNQAVRYMLKWFLADAWKAMREIRGLPTDDALYPVAKLGMTPHGCDPADSVRPLIKPTMADVVENTDTYRAALANQPTAFLIVGSGIE